MKSATINLEAGMRSRTSARARTDPAEIVARSRAMQRLVGMGSAGAAGWITAQLGRYRYLAATTVDGVLVRTVLSEYLACEVAWSG